MIAMKNAIKDNKPEIYINPDDTWLNQKIDTIEKVKEWILVALGYPLVTVELDDNQLNTCIGNAIRIFTRYEYHPDSYLTVNLRYYKPGEGLDLHDFHIMSVKDISTQRDAVFGAQPDMFFGMYAYMGQGQGSPMYAMGNQNPVGMWTLYHNAHEFFDLSKKMTGSNPDFMYDKVTQHLRLMPEPHTHGQDRFILLTVNAELPMSEYYGNDTVLRLALAEAKMLVGTIRKKFQGTALLGGGTLDTDIYNEGKEEKDKILEELISRESKGQCFYVS